MISNIIFWVVVLSSPFWGTTNITRNNLYRARVNISLEISCTVSKSANNENEYTVPNSVNNKESLIKSRNQLLDFQFSTLWRCYFQLEFSNPSQSNNEKLRKETLSSHFRCDLNFVKVFDFFVKIGKLIIPEMLNWFRRIWRGKPLTFCLKYFPLKEKNWRPKIEMTLQLQLDLIVNILHCYCVSEGSFSAYLQK